MRSFRTLPLSLAGTSLPSPLSSTLPRQLSIAGDVCHRPFRHFYRPAGQLRTVKGGDKSGKACEHWDRLGEDLGLIKGLGVGGYRCDEREARRGGRQGVLEWGGGGCGRPIRFRSCQSPP